MQLKPLAMEKVPDLISLRVKCPICGHSIMDEKRLVDNCPSIKLKIAIGDQEGIIHLSSVYESYNYLCNIETPDGELIKLYCPHCSSEIKSSYDCDICKSGMISLDLELGGSVNVCSRIGCQNHFVKFVDFSFALKKFYIDEDHTGRPFVDDMKTALADKKPLNEEEEHVESIGVHPSFRGRGLAKMMLWKVMEILRQTKSENLTLGVDSVNSPAVNLYERLGFETVSRTVRYSWKDDE